MKQHRDNAAWRAMWSECSDRLERLASRLDLGTFRTSTLEALAGLLAEAEALIEHDDPESEE